MRLALPVVALWLGIGMGFSWARQRWWLVALIAVVAVICWFVRGNRAQLAGVLGFALLGLLMIVLRAALSQPQADVFGEHGITFRVLEDPKAVESGFGALNFQRGQRFLADVQVNAGKTTSSLPVLLSVDESGWRLSERGECQARIDPAEGWQRYRGFARCRGAAVRLAEVTRLEAVAAYVRQALRQAVAGMQPSRAAGLLPGLTLGDESSLDSISESELQAAGLGHLTAVSGANIAILLGALQLLLRRTAIPWNGRVVIQAAAVAAFVVVVRPTPSVVRAAAMALLGLWVVWRGGRRRGGRLLLAASAALLLIDPWLAVSWGFALSVAATAGLIFLAPLIAPAESPWWRRAGGTAVAAGVATLPVLLAMGVRPTFASVPANVVAELLVAPATISGVLAALLFAIGSLHSLLLPLGYAAVVIAQVGVWAAEGVLRTAERANDSWLSVPVVSPIGLLSLGLSAFLWWRWRRVGVALVVLGCAVTAGSQIASASANWPPPDWQLIGCDVGQGDATLVRTGPHAAVVIDSGPQATALHRCLEAAEVESVPLFIPTHWHADHVGAVSALSGLGVREVWQPCGVEPAAGERLVREVLGDANWRDASSLNGGVGSFGLEVLLCPHGELGADDGQSVNDSSLLMALHLPQGSVLLSADAEGPLQRDLMSRFAPGSFRFLKLPHHGSAAVEPGFAEWSGAEAAWVSVGIDNDYGHPAPETLATYRALGVPVWSTAACGDVALTPAGFTTARRCGPV